MYVQPNTTVHLIRNVGLDNSYTNTHYFSNVSEQYSYFVSHAKRTLNNYSYVIPTSNVIRVNIKADEIYDVNYIAFQNSNFGTKWFYAFVNSIDYVSNDVSDIHFEIDVIQTWLTEYQLRPCFIERQHVANDEIGENIVAEPLEVGEYVGNEYEVLYLNNMACVIAVIDHDKQGSLIDNVYSGCYLVAYDMTRAGISNMNTFLQQFVDKPNQIAGIYMVPDCACVSSDVGTHIDNVLPSKRITSTLNGANKIDGYVPRNNKLYTYPYNFYRLSNGNGGVLNIRYEFCDGNPVVTLSGTCTQPVQLGVRVENYKKGSTRKTEVMVTSNYPVCAWSNSAYQNWVGTQAIPNLLTSIGTGVATGIVNPSVGIISGVMGVSNVLLGGYKASNSADTLQGSISSGGVNLSKTFGSIDGWRMSICAEYAKIIDDYFTRYGYAIKEIAQPNITSRKSFNYIKTCDCSITGFMPSDVAKQIADIHNRGITYWHNHEEIGNFLVDNTL